MKEQLESLNSISINFGENGMMIVNILLAFIMFGVALGIRLDTFKQVFRHPRSIITGILLQWVGLPAVTFLICMALNHWITPMVALGMILVASCPGGNISNFISSLSKGNVELSVSMTAVTTAFAPLITPFNFFIWGTLYYNAISITGEIPRLVIPFLPMLWQILHEEDHQTGSDPLHPPLLSNGSGIILPEFPVVHRQYHIHLPDCTGT